MTYNAKIWWCTWFSIENQLNQWFNLILQGERRWTCIESISADATKRDRWTSSSRCKWKLCCWKYKHKRHSVSPHSPWNLQRLQVLRFILLLKNSLTMNKGLIMVWCLFCYICFHLQNYYGKWLPHGSSDLSNQAGSRLAIATRGGHMQERWHYEGGYSKARLKEDTPNIRNWWKQPSEGGHHPPGHHLQVGAWAKQLLRWFLRRSIALAGR